MLGQSAVTAVRNEFSCEILGSMGRGVFVTRADLTTVERLRILKQLREAAKAGYDSCIVATSGVYATKKLTPRIF